MIMGGQAMARGNGRILLPSFGVWALLSPSAFTFSSEAGAATTCDVQSMQVASPGSRSGFCQRKPKSRKSRATWLR
jgi:hypothetical protein